MVVNIRAGCDARNLTCCYDDGDNDEYDSDYDRKRRGINDAGYYCCDRLAYILGYGNASNMRNTISFSVCNNNY